MNVPAPRRGRHGAQRAADAPALAARQHALAAAGAAAVWVGVVAARRLIGAARGERPPARRSWPAPPASRSLAGRVRRSAAPRTRRSSAPVHGGHELPLRPARRPRHAARARRSSLPLAAVTAPRARAAPPVGRARTSAAGCAADQPRASASPGARSRSCFVLVRAGRSSSSRRPAPRSPTAGAAGAPCPADAAGQELRRPARSTSTSRSTASATTTRRARCTSLADQVAAVRAQEQSRKVSHRPARRPDPAARHPRQPRRLRRDRLHQQRDRRRVRLHIDGLAFDDRVLRRRGRQQRLVAVAQRRDAHLPLLGPARRRARGRALHPPRPGPPQRGRARPVRRARRRAEGLDVPAPGHRPAARAPAGRRSIVPGNGQKAFREYVEDQPRGRRRERTTILDANGRPLPMVDPTTDGLPARLARDQLPLRAVHAPPGAQARQQKSHAYNSYTFGDPATPMSRALPRRPDRSAASSTAAARCSTSTTCTAAASAGAATRTRTRPSTTRTPACASTRASQSPSSRLDSQSHRPGRDATTSRSRAAPAASSRSRASSSWHCHIAEHYVAGMWSFWRVFDTTQPDLAPLPDRAAPAGRRSTRPSLIGKTMQRHRRSPRTTSTTGSSRSCPPQGMPAERRGRARSGTDDRPRDPASPSTSASPRRPRAWPDLPRDGPATPAGLPGDEFVGDRPVILFNPTERAAGVPAAAPADRPAAAVLAERPLRRAVARRDADGAAKPGAADPWANRADGICPTGAPDRARSTSSTIELPDPGHDDAAEATRPARSSCSPRTRPPCSAGTKPAEPLAIRANDGDCVDDHADQRAVDAEDASDLFSKVEHAHPPRAVRHAGVRRRRSPACRSSSRSARTRRRTTRADRRGRAAGDTHAARCRASAKFRPGVGIAVGQGDRRRSRSTRSSRRSPAQHGHARRSRSSSAHASGESAGVEFVQYALVPGRPARQRLLARPRGRHPRLGPRPRRPAHRRAEGLHLPRPEDRRRDRLRHDRRHPHATARSVAGQGQRLASASSRCGRSTRTRSTDSTINLRAEPWSRPPGDRRRPVAAVLLATGTATRTRRCRRAYRGDPFVIRTINVGPRHRHAARRRAPLPDRGAPRGRRRQPARAPIDTLHYGVSERFTRDPRGRRRRHRQAGGRLPVPQRHRAPVPPGRVGHPARARRASVGDLQPLPGHDRARRAGTLPDAAPAAARPSRRRPGDPCPSRRARSARSTSPRSTCPARRRPHAGLRADRRRRRRRRRRAKRRAARAARRRRRLRRRCSFTNERTARPRARPPRASFHVGEARPRRSASSGVNVGFNPEQTVATGAVARRTATTSTPPTIGSAIISDFGGNDTGTQRPLRRASSSPRRAPTFADPQTGAPRDVGTQVDVHVPGGEQLPRLHAARSPTTTRSSAATSCPYTAEVDGPALVNYRVRSRARDDAADVPLAHQRRPGARRSCSAYAGDPVRVHAIGAPGQRAAARVLARRPVAGRRTRGSRTAQHRQRAGLRRRGRASTRTLTGGAGGWAAHASATTSTATCARPFTEAGMWGLMRVLSDDQDCPVKPLPGLDCLGQDPIQPEATPVSSDPGPGSGGDSSPVVRPRVTQPAPTSTKKTTTNSPSRSGDDDASDKTARRPERTVRPPAGLHRESAAHRPATRAERPVEHPRPARAPRAHGGLEAHDGGHHHLEGPPRRHHQRALAPRASRAPPARSPARTRSRSRRAPVRGPSTVSGWMPRSRSHGGAEAPACPNQHHRSRRDTAVKSQTRRTPSARRMARRALVLAPALLALGAASAQAAGSSLTADGLHISTGALVDPAGRTWVADHNAGFCRVTNATDTSPGKIEHPELPGQAGTRTCLGGLLPDAGTGPDAAGQPTFYDPSPTFPDSGDELAFIPDGASPSSEVVRAQWNRNTGKFEFKDTITMQGARGRPVSVALGPDDNLYVTFQREDTIQRIRNIDGRAAASPRSSAPRPTAAAPPRSPSAAPRRRRSSTSPRPWACASWRPTPQRRRPRIATSLPAAPGTISALIYDRANDALYAGTGDAAGPPVADATSTASTATSRTPPAPPASRRTSPRASRWSAASASVPTAT